MTTALTQQDKDSLWKTAQSLAGSDASDLLPDRWRGKPQAVFQMALQARELGIDPISACRLTYLVHGQPALKTEAIIGLVNARAGMASEIMFEERGELMSDDYEVRAYAISAKSGQRLDGIWVGMRMAHEEGWTKKKGNKYGGTFRQQQLRYRAASSWARLYAPEVLMGMYTQQEVQEGSWRNAEAHVIPDAPAVAELAADLAGTTEPEPEEEPEPIEATATVVEPEEVDDDNPFKGWTAPEKQEDPA